MEIRLSSKNVLKVVAACYVICVACQAAVKISKIVKDKFGPTNEMLRDSAREKIVAWHENE